jgi:hypothetical protein
MIYIMTFKTYTVANPPITLIDLLLHIYIIVLRNTRY